MLLVYSPDKRHYAYDGPKISCTETYARCYIREDGTIRASVWCYGYPDDIPTATVSEVMNEVAYIEIGYDCHVPHDGRLLGCSY